MKIKTDSDLFQPCFIEDYACLFLGADFIKLITFLYYMARFNGRYFRVKKNFRNRCSI